MKRALITNKTFDKCTACPACHLSEDVARCVMGELVIERFYATHILANGYAILHREPLPYPDETTDIPEWCELPYATQGENKCKT